MAADDELCLFQSNEVLVKNDKDFIAVEYVHSRRWLGEILGG